MKNNNNDHLYRKSVGIILLNKNQEIFTAKRIDTNSWQLPQGGVDDSELEDDAIFREIYEETSIKKDFIKIISKSKRYYYYNLPKDLQKKFWNNQFLGQRQKWYLAKFTGNDSNISLFNPGYKQEFIDFKWSKKCFIIDNIISFKKKLYIDVFEEFKIK